MYLSPNIKIISIIIFAVLSISSILAFYIMYQNKYENIKSSVYRYNASSNLLYNVIVKQPNALNASKLEDGKLYISDLIDQIIIKPAFTFSSDSSTEISGFYKVKASIENLVVEGTESKLVWKRELLLKDSTPFSNSGNTYNLKDELPVDFKAYMSEITQINKNLDLNVTSNLKIIFETSYNTKSQYGQFNDAASPTLTIPLNNKLMEITSDNKYEKSNSIELSNKIIKPNYKRNLDIILTVFVFFLLMFLIVVICTRTKHIDHIIKQLKSINKKYGDRLSIIEKVFDLSNYEVIPVSNIDDLARISDDLTKPLLCKKELLSYYVVDNKTIYYYALESN
jgi:hypothetical protein